MASALTTTQKHDTISVARPIVVWSLTTPLLYPFASLPLSPPLARRGIPIWPAPVLRPVAFDGFPSPKTQIRSRKDLSMAYTPGVARVCLAIAEDPERAFNLTIKRNTVAVVSDGTAVLGLGDGHR
jgi:hypothetical protein